MGSKPSVPHHKDAIQPQPQHRHRHVHGHDNHGHAEVHEHDKDRDEPQSRRKSPELAALFKHLAFCAAASRKSDPVSRVQEVLMQELGIAQPDYEDLKRALQRECNDVTVITEEEMERICAAFPDAAARCAENGSPFALFLNQIPSHLALARSLEQVVQTKAAGAAASNFGGLVAQNMGHWHGQMEVGEHPSSSLSMCANLNKEVSLDRTFWRAYMHRHTRHTQYTHSVSPLLTLTFFHLIGQDVSQAVTLAHDNLVQMIWNSVILLNKDRRHVRSHVDGKGLHGVASDEQVSMQLSSLGRFFDMWCALGK